ncbi:ABC transporter ATP-binding protein uup [Rubripirellula lacrimiformis]|uniref:ATP-binding protein Uup n=1 Tax=Rubripirellula lacrimiformis TaxID=1930273 RepID=A0A517N6J0_9BACT|nr:ATP-binding cassette domain-containing protein [Rubripirellula lacrimiformis]QDT02764.1 ABC transporter ATP-binding protein uup [Rubripirellula lacrimiformis]
MPLVSLDDLSIGFRGPLLLDGVSAVIERGEKIGLLGRNGAGKTTLLRMFDGEVVPDHGGITFAPHAKVARLTQDVPRDWTGTVTSIVMAGQPGRDDPETHWQVEHAVESTLSKMELDGDALFETLSSGMKRRVLLARAIAMEPDVLLLDEPTNHLDIESILWIENFLKRFRQTLVFITHDRSFLQSLATRIWEIDRGRLFDWTCDYTTFLQRKEAALQAEEKQNALFDKKLAQEEVWIRQGIKARRTRNEGRVRALKQLRLQRGDRRSVEGKAKLNLQEAARSGALVADVKEISFSYGDRVILNDFSTTLMRGDRVGIMGPNGAGKTTLLKLLLGQLEPDQGTVKLGTNLQISYFDQLRDTLDPEKTVQENVGEGSDKVLVGDKSKHIVGYLQDFLFTPERARTPVKYLSGGERNRALLAKLMTKPANVIVLDEPTNDLDSETLDLLEEQLIDFSGTVLMVSHDRTFLNNVVTSTIVYEEGGVKEYDGGYDDWKAAVARQAEFAKNEPTSKPKQAASSADKPKSKPAKKLSFKDKHELDKMPQRIEQLESDIATINSVMAEPDYYQKGGDKIASDAAKLKELQQELATAYARWEELENH